MLTASDSFPNTKLTDPADKQVIEKLTQFLERHIQRRNLLQKEVTDKKNNFRNILMELERENVSLKNSNNEQEKIISLLEDRVYKLQCKIDHLLDYLNTANDTIRMVREQLGKKNILLKQQKIKECRIIQRYNTVMEKENDRRSKQFCTQMRQQQEHFQREIKKKDHKLKFMKQLLSTHENASDNTILIAPTTSSSKIQTIEDSIPKTFKEKSSMVMPIKSQTPKSFHTKTNLNNIQENAIKESIPMISENKFSMPSSSKTKIAEGTISIAPIDSPSFRIASVKTASTTKKKTDKKIKKVKIPVVNPRYRVQSRFINHHPSGMVPTGTILQPQVRHKHTIQKLTDPKIFMTKSAIYCLYTQEQDTDGELETKLYKANILPTSGGGVQIVFNDIECLKQVSPTATQCNKQINIENNSSK